MKSFIYKVKNKYNNGFSSYDLKLIALIIMVIDHIGAVLIENGYLHSVDISQSMYNLTRRE